jgi:membrane protein YdbS with pleckstrin-like domain
MPCGSCGSEVSSESVYCPKCGTRLNFDEPGPPENQPGPVSPKDQFRDTTKGRQGGDVHEEDLWKGGYSGKDMIGNWLLAGLASIALITGSVMWPSFRIGFLPIAGLIWVFLVGLLAYRKLAVHYELTSQRFIHKIGILKQRTDRIEVIDIDDVTVEQGIVQRMLGVGSITVTSSDRTHPELRLRGINEAKRIADLIDDVRRKERRARGLHIEAI